MLAGVAAGYRQGRTNNLGVAHGTVFNSALLETFQPYLEQV